VKRAPEVCRLAGITYRQLDHWIAKGIVGLSPSASRRNSGPPYRTFTDGDVEIIRRIADEKRDIDKSITRWMDHNFHHRTDDRRYAS
jgi:DNA-binding transcriptional MerR regulator